jgi:hypothetical protein
MSLCYREQRQLRGIEVGLFRSDSHLAGVLDVFGRLYRGQDMPASERVLSGQGRDQGAVTRIALATLPSAAANRDGRRPHTHRAGGGAPPVVCPRNDELMVIAPRCAGLSRRPRQHEWSSPDAHEPRRERAAVADPGGDARASPSRAPA